MKSDVSIMPNSIVDYEMKNTDLDTRKKNPGYTY